MYRCYTCWRLCLVSWPQPFQCFHVLPFFSQVPQRTHPPVLQRHPVHKEKYQPISLDSLPDITSQLPAVNSTELHVWVQPISKIYTDDMVHFPVRSRSGNCYIMLAYHVDTNAILVSVFQSCNDRHRISAYNSIMLRLKYKGHSVDIQVLDDEASANYRRTIVDEWN